MGANAPIFMYSMVIMCLSTCVCLDAHHDRQPHLVRERAQLCRQIARDQLDPGTGYQEELDADGFDRERLDFATPPGYPVAAVRWQLFGGSCSVAAVRGAAVRGAAVLCSWLDPPHARAARTTLPPHHHPILLLKYVQSCPLLPTEKAQPDPTAYVLPSGRPR